jgi:hypothetical protein
MKPSFFWGGLVILSFTLRTIFADDRQLIWTGWDIPTPAQFRSDVGEFEKAKVFDGSGIVATRQRPEGKVESVSYAFNTNHWAWSEFEQAVADLQAAKPVRCTNNFLLIGANPGNVDWFDDAGWAELTDHWRLLARVAKKGGLSGLMFDPEPYTKPWSQFLYSAQPSKSKYSFTETQAKARQRGRDVMKAVAEEFPTITIFAYRMFSDLFRPGDRTRLAANLEGEIYGLLPAFVDGWFDVITPTITVIDGNESSYNYQTTDKYANAFARVKILGPRLVSPENRAKFQRQVLVGQGIYLDALTSESPKPLNLMSLSPVSHLVTFASAAFESANEFVWVYGEKGRFWPSKSSLTPWRSKIPGVEAALSCAKNPVQFARDFFENASAKDNLLKDVSFVAGAWSTWQDSGSKGTASLTGGVAQLTGTQYGSIGQSVPVKPEQAYLVSVKVKRGGHGTASLLINWRNNRKFVAQNEIVEFAPTDSPDAGGWHSISGLVIVPAEANELMFLCIARGQQGDEAKAAFKEPMVLTGLQ